MLYYYICFTEQYFSKIKVVILCSDRSDTWIMASVFHSYILSNDANHKYEYIILRLKSEQSAATWYSCGRRQTAERW
jgi:hypothetical protein